VLGQHHGALGHEAVYQRLLAAATVHGSSSSTSRNHPPRKLATKTLIPKNAKSAHRPERIEQSCTRN
jgi:hypothetical protein